jgi:hypothetical protein
VRWLLVGRMRGGNRRFSSAGLEELEFESRTWIGCYVLQLKRQEGLR